MSTATLRQERFEVADGTLADKHAGGDSKAFAELFRRYYHRLVALCEGRMDDPHLAEDVAQETLLRALCYLAGYDRTRPMWPWLRTIAVRIAYQESQRASRERSADVETDEDEATVTPIVGPPDIEQREVVRSALSAVPPRQRTALVVRYVDDWSSADAAELHGMNVNAFEQLLWRARRRLSREYLQIA